MIASVVAEFAALHLALNVELRLSDKPDLIEDDIDIALQVERPDSGRLVARHLLTNRRVIVAARSYVRMHGLPMVPVDVLRHRCICLIRGRRILDNWRFFIDGEDVEIQVPRFLMSDSTQITGGWALDGRGVALKVLWDVSEDLSRGRLLQCLSDYTRHEVNLYAVYAQQRHLPARMRAFLDFIRAKFQDGIPGASPGQHVLSRPGMSGAP